MGIVLELLGTLFGELILQVLFEVVWGAIFHSKQLREFHPSAPTPGVVVAFVLIGAATGAASILAWPRLAIADPTLRLINLAVSPIICGVVMAVWGRAREHVGKPRTAFDYFVGGAALAVGVAAVRMLLAA